MARGEHPRLFLFGLARELGVPVHEIESWPNHDVEEWAAYFSLEAERQRHKEKPTFTR